MIQELIGKKEFYFTDPLFDKYFMSREETRLEEEKRNKLRKMIDDFFKKVYNLSQVDIDNMLDFDYHYVLGAYLENYGFYSISDADRGHYDIERYGEDINIAFHRIIDDLLWDNIDDKKFQNSEQVKEKIRNYFPNFLDRDIDILCVTLIIIDAWNRYYDGNISEDIVTYYEHKLNDIAMIYGNGAKFVYNKETKRFDFNSKDKTDEINTKDISDGHHTFHELYMHRTMLFCALCNLLPEVSWKSKKHFDEENDPMYEGDFIAGINTEDGPITYHIKLEYWDIFNIPVIDRAPKYDNYGNDEVIKRIRTLSKKRSNNLR